MNTQQKQKQQQQNSNSTSTWRESSQQMAYATKYFPKSVGYVDVCVAFKLFCVFENQCWHYVALSLILCMHISSFNDDNMLSSFAHDLCNDILISTMHWHVCLAAINFREIFIGSKPQLHISTHGSDS